MPFMICRRYALQIYVIWIHYKVTISDEKKKFCLLISLKIIAAITCNYLIINYVNRNYDTVVQWLSILYNFIQLSLNVGSVHVQAFKSWSQRVQDSRWTGSLTMVSAANKTKGLSTFNHATKTIYLSSPCVLIIRLFRAIRSKVCLGKCQRECTLTDETTSDCVHRNVMHTLLWMSFKLTQICE